MSIVATDPFAQYQTGLDSPARHSPVITPSDTDDIGTSGSRGIYVGVGGDITLDTFFDTQILYKNVPTGFILPVVTKRVRATGTTATNLVAMY